MAVLILACLCAYMEERIRRATVLMTIRAYGPFATGIRALQLLGHANVGHNDEFGDKTLYAR